MGMDKPPNDMDIWPEEPDPPNFVLDNNPPLLGPYRGLTGAKLAPNKSRRLVIISPFRLSTTPPRSTSLPSPRLLPANQLLSRLKHFFQVLIGRMAGSEGLLIMPARQLR